MRSKLSGLVILVGLLIYVPAYGGTNFGPNVEMDTSEYFTIMDYFLSPYQLMDYNFLGGGARARAMGGAFLAISDDPTAASWNPAGLIQMDKIQMNLSFSSNMRRGEYSTTLGSRLSYSDDQKYDENTISFASVVIPFKLREKDLVAGVLYQRLADIYQKNQYYLEADSINFVDTTIYNYLFPPIDDKVTGRLDKINLSLATKLLGSLSFGAGINIYFGNFTTNSNWLASYDNGFNGLRFYPQIETDYSGVNLTTGLMYMTEKFHLASVLKTPFTLKEENDMKLFTDMIIQGIVVDGSYLLSPFFKTEREWKMPTIIGFGAVYQANSLTLAADVELKNYSKTEVTYKRNVADPATNDVTTGEYITDSWWVEENREPPSVRSLGWRNITQFRLGVEYVINTGLGNIPLRVGFRNDPQLYTTQLDSSWVYLRDDIQGNNTFLQSKRGIENGDWVNGNIFSFGTGVAWSQIKLDISFEYAKYDDVNRQIITGIIPYDPGDRLILDPLTVRDFSQTETKKFSRIIVSFTGFF
jgi:long-subunit fatty acid transport protein